MSNVVPCQGVEPQLADSEPAVLPLDEHGVLPVISCQHPVLDTDLAHPERFKLPACRVETGCSFSLSYGCIRGVAEEGFEPSAWSLWATRSTPLSYPARRCLLLSIDLFLNKLVLSAAWHRARR